MLLAATPSYAQVTLGTSTSVTNPQRSGEASTGIYTPASGSVAITSLGTEKMRVNATGVGIGTNSPGDLLDVLGKGVFGSTVTNRSSSGDATFPLNVIDGGANQLRLVHALVQKVDFNINTTPSRLDITDTDHSSLVPISIMINGTGDIGIGTTAPFATLDVRGKAHVSPSNTASVVVSNALSVETNGTDDGIRYTQDLIGSIWIGHSGIGIIGTDIEPLTFKTGINGSTGAIGSTGTEWMRITTSGSVGIGTDAPDTLLSLNGQSAQTIDMVRETTASTTGNNLTVRAGGAAVGGTNLNGGTLNLTSGTSTGVGSSGINFNIYNAGSSGSSDNSPTTAISLTGAGLNLISGVYQVNGTQMAASNLLNGVTGSGNIVLAISPTLRLQILAGHQA